MRDGEPRVLPQWSGREGPLSSTDSVAALVAAMAAGRPDAVAVVDGPARLSYRELITRADSVARRLGDADVTRGRLVGLCCARSADLIVGMLGILRAGAAYVPLDPDYPAERLSFMLADAGTTVVLGQDALLSRLPLAGRVRIPIEAVREAPAPAVPVTIDDPAYLIYTSGSTGAPKGVLVPHRGIVRLVRDCDYVSLGPDTVVTQLSNASFDAITFEVWGALANGGTVVIVPQEMLLAPDRLAALLRAESVNTMFVTTALFNTLLSVRPDVFHTVEQLYFGGETLNPAKVALALAPDTGPATLHNIYGPTETTTFATCQRLREPPLTGGPIGTPIRNTRAWVVAADGTLAGVAEPGELWLGGAGVALGYWHRQALTADRFVPDPFGGTPGARLYRTGDRVRWRADGGLEFLGRLDRQVKVRGFRVEPDEVALALTAHPAVEAAVVVGVRTGDGEDNELVGYAQPIAGRSVAASELQAFLAERLPAYLVPAQLILLDALPLTANGKVDHARLPAADSPAPAAVPADSPLWQRIAAVWAESLSVEQVTATDDFFALGGNSLMAVRIAQRLQDTLGVQVSAATMFVASTPTELAQQAAGAASAAGRTPIRRVGGRLRAPLSLIEEEVWFFAKLVPDNMAYHTQISLRVAGTVDVDMVEAALTEIVHRHESLRTTFTEDEAGQAWQIIHPPGPVRVHRADLSGLDPERAAIALAGLIRAQTDRVFDLGTGPLFSWTVVRLPADTCELLLVEHHFVHDGWSFRLLSGELAERYNAAVAGLPLPAAELPVQYADFAEWQRAAADGAELAGQRAYWLDRLRDPAPVLALPADRPRPPRQSFRGHQIRVDLPMDVVAELRALCRARGLTLFTVMYSAFTAWLHRYSGERDLWIGSGFANRRPEVERLIGMFVNTVVLRCGVDPGMRFADLLGAARDVVSSATANQEYPFVRLVKELHPDRDLAINPLFQVMFSFHDAPAPRLHLGGAPVEVLEHANGSAKADLNVIVIPHDAMSGGAAGSDERISVLWEYSIDLFDRDTAGRMVAQYVRLLAAAVREPAARLWQLPLVGPDDRTLLDRFATGA